ncbi:MAG: cyclopropane-fatty-acyl-phospholipid synthase [Desulfobacteraceae bacterium]
MIDTTLPSKQSRPVGVSQKRAAGFAKRLFFKLLSKIKTGQVTVHEGARTDTFGKATPDFPLTVTITIHDPKAYTRIAFGGSIGAAESYMLRYWDVDDLTALVRIVIRNQILLKDLDSGPARLASPIYKAFHFLRRNTKSGSRKNILAHYDLGNDFYRLFLDETMTYSSGVFERSGATLKDAAIAKYDRICRKLNLSEKDHVLEIGTGWGGFTLHAVKNYGCRVTTTTISDEQHRLAKARFEDAGIMDRVVLLKSDYRELQGCYDKLVSIEMIEAVGHQYLDTFMARCADLLKPDGVMVLQAITIADRAFDEHRKGVDFIKRYIFPGSCIPSLTAISRAAANATDLRLYNLEDITPHYAETLRRWRHNFLKNIDNIRSLGFSEVFNRMWEYYLRYCEAGFEERFLGSVQLVMTRPLARMPAIGWPDRSIR